MKKFTALFVALFLGLSAGLVHAADANDGSKSAETGNYIPWTWDDVED